MITKAKTEDEPDVIVVGSGAAGGMAAYVLTAAGLRVLMLEAGRNYDPVTETPMFNLPSEAPLRAASTPDKPLGFFDATVDGGTNIPGEPYTMAQGTSFRWWRARMLGGRTNHWGRLSLRFGARRTRLTPSSHWRGAVRHIWQSRRAKVNYDRHPSLHEPASRTDLAFCGCTVQSPLGRALAQIVSLTVSTGYGTDPKLSADTVPWGRVMTREQLNLAAAVADTILPPSATSPVPSALSIQEFVDEWISAPYPTQTN